MYTQMQRQFDVLNVLHSFVLHGLVTRVAAINGQINFLISRRHEIWLKQVYEVVNLDCEGVFIKEISSTCRGPTGP